MGEYGRAFALLNLTWFGYFGYIYLLFFLYPAYALYKDANLTLKRLKIIIATVLLSLGVLIVQFLLCKQGKLGEILVQKILPTFGIFGVGIIIILCFISGLSLLAPRQMLRLYGVLLALGMRLVRYLTSNCKEAYSYLKPLCIQITKKYSAIILAKLERFFASPSLKNFDRTPMQEPPPKPNESDIYPDSAMQDSNKSTHVTLLTVRDQTPPAPRHYDEFDTSNALATPHNREVEERIKLENEEKYKKMVRIVDEDEEGEVLKIDPHKILKRAIAREQEQEILQEEETTQYTKIVSDETHPSKPLKTQDMYESSVQSTHIFESSASKDFAPDSSPAPLEAMVEQPSLSIPKDPRQNDKTESIQSPKAKLEITKNFEASTALLDTLDRGELETPRDYSLPSTALLQAPKDDPITFEEGEIDQKIQNLLTKLKVFKIDGDVARIYSGPVVTTFEFRPAPNVKVSRIQSLSDDLAMALSARSIRIQAPIPGKDVVGIEVPNTQREMIYLREILESEVFVGSSSPLALGLGKDIVGNPFVTDLKKLPHLLIAGTTGSGKSVGLNAMILSLLYRNAPENLRLIMIDPKKVEFSMYEEIPHLLTPIITDSQKAIIALSNVAREMERRYEIMKEIKTKTIDGYNIKARAEGKELLPFIVIIIDELADLMMTGGKNAEASIIRIAQMGRAAGLHLIVATQRPSVDVVTGLIKTNLPAKIAYKVGSRMDSRVILDSEGAQNLLGQGDMLFSVGGGGSVLRLHAPWASEEEIESIVEFIRSQREVEYDSSFLAESNQARYMEENDMPQEGGALIDEAKKMMLLDGKTSISNLQRRLGIGYNKAASIVEELEAQGFLSAPNAKGVREIIG